MRIEVNEATEFCDELRLSTVVAGIVRYRIDTTPEQDESVSRRVGLWLTAVLEIDGEKSILEAGIDCGSEDCRDGQEPVATNKAEIIRSCVARVCEDLGLSLRHGKIEVF